MKRQIMAATAGAALIILTAALIWQGYGYYRARAANEAIEGLMAGRDIEVSDDAPAEVLLARGYFLMQRDRLARASEIFYLLEQRGDTSHRAQLLYNMGNARLKRAITMIENMNTDRAVAMVDLAKDLYREALSVNPNLWDAKYNLDVAMRLVRDLPQVGGGGDENEEVAKKLWTLVPGFPSGLP